MKTSTIAFSVASVLIIVAFIASLVKIHSAAALTDATSTATSTSTASDAPASTSTPAAAQNTQTAPSSTATPAMTLVHITGTKYVDYFTDGTKTYSFPGDPAVDGKLNQPNAPIPSHTGSKWVSTSGMDAYDTPSGDLEVGDYAQEADGSYIYNSPAYTYTDATSSVAIPAHIAMSKTVPTLPAQTAPSPAPAQSAPAPADATSPASMNTSTSTPTPTATSSTQ